MTSAERLATEDIRSPAMLILVKAVAREVALQLKLEFARPAPIAVQPVLLDVKQAAVYLGRSEQAVQHLIFQRDIPVVRTGRRVHLHRRDLDAWIEKNTY
jgi:excisionase family DNA binding protein